MKFLKFAALSLVFCTFTASTSFAHLSRAETELERRTRILYDAQAGDAKAQYEYVAIFLPIYAQDRAGSIKALNWYKKSAAQGYAPAKVKIGDMYAAGRNRYDGSGIEKDMQKACIWYWGAAQQGLAEAEFKTGKCSHSGDGSRQNYATARDWYHKAMRQGFWEAAEALAIMAEKGDGQQPQHTNAYYFYRIAMTS